MNNLRTCNACGWVHFGVTRDFAETEVERFNKYFEGLSKEQQDDYYGGKKATMKSYDSCFKCGGNYTNFRAYEKDDCPDGCTIQPILLSD